MELLQRYRDCLEQAATLYQAELHTLTDGSSLMLFHSQDDEQNYLTHALCCGELMRALGHALQIEVADSGITLQLQLGLTQGHALDDLGQAELLLSEPVQAALALSQHSRNLLLVERDIGDDPLVRERARIRPIASPEGACCVERLLEPTPRCWSASWRACTSIGARSAGFAALNPTCAVLTANDARQVAGRACSYTGASRSQAAPCLSLLPREKVARRAG